MAWFIKFQKTMYVFQYSVCTGIWTKIKKSASCCFFDASFMHNIGGVFDRGWHDFLSMYYIHKDSCHRLSETPPIFFI